MVAGAELEILSRGSCFGGGGSWCLRGADLDFCLRDIALAGVDLGAKENEGGAQGVNGQCAS